MNSFFLLMCIIWNKVMISVYYNEMKFIKQEIFYENSEVRNCKWLVFWGNGRIDFRFWLKKAWNIQVKLSAFWTNLDKIFQISNPLYRTSTVNSISIKANQLFLPPESIIHLLTTNIDIPNYPCLNITEFLARARFPFLLSEKISCFR